MIPDDKTTPAGFEGCALGRNSSQRFIALVQRCLVVFFASVVLAKGADVHHYVFFNRDRERINETAFLSTKAFEGAQLKYTWRELERQKDVYEFHDIQRDLSFLQSKGKRLFIQIQDASFDTNVVPIPRYLRVEPEYHGGADLQYSIDNDDEEHATPQGWVARRWDPAVRERFHRLLLALGRQFDGQIEGINLPETAVDFGESGKLYPKGFTPEVYRNEVISNMAVLKRAFPRSVAMQYANFMPGGQRYLKEVYRTAKALNVSMGGPDLLPDKPGQMRNSYPLLQEYSSDVPTGIAVQEGNYQYLNPKTGQPVTVSELFAFASGHLRVQYIFWGAQEPFYSAKVIPFLRSQQ
jgi:hypothetical protein